MNDIEKVVPAFELALGEEDGTLFGAILWPVDIGAVPYSTPIELFFVENGFILKGESGEHPIEFQGVSDETLAELERRVIVILEKVGDEFDQHPVRQGW